MRTGGRTKMIFISYGDEVHPDQRVKRVMDDWQVAVRDTDVCTYPHQFRGQRVWGVSVTADERTAEHVKSLCHEDGTLRPKDGATRPSNTRWERTVTIPRGFDPHMVR